MNTNFQINQTNFNQLTKKINFARNFSGIKIDTIEPLGPLDGRYQPKVAALSEYFSESAFNRYRIKVEIEWLKFLINDGVIQLENSQTQEDIIAKLDGIYALTTEENTDFNTQVKEIEAVTNHDIKAVEYWIKQQIENVG
jgi:adenylosuccinate lyase